MQSLEYFGVFTRQFWNMNVRAPLTWSEPAIFGGFSARFPVRVLIHFVSRIFCVIENHYVHTAKSFSFSGLKLTYLGEFYLADFTSSHRYRHNSRWEPHKFFSGYMYQKIRKTKSVQCFANFLIKFVDRFFALTFCPLLAHFIAQIIQSARLSVHSSKLGPPTPHPQGSVATPLPLCRMDI